MEKKYIIKLKENERLYKAKLDAFNGPVIQEIAGAPYTEPDLEQVKKEAYDEGYDDAKGGYENGFENGMIVAWEAARKICLNECDGGMTPTEVNKIFGVGFYRDALLKYSAIEAIEKIRQFEQKKEEIKVGDEVKNIESGWTAIVTKSEEGHLTLMGDSGAIANGYDAKYFVKTGRHFPEIAAVLEKMREDAT